ncbi:MAG: hypothetical protein EBZ48_09250, partial [Proteobacteria bacterium]|nr:hypothetical protein [Pseudomonadota bacterium]
MEFSVGFPAEQKIESTKDTNAAMVSDRIGLERDRATLMERDQNLPMSGSLLPVVKSAAPFALAVVAASLVMLASPTPVSQQVATVFGLCIAALGLGVVGRELGAAPWRASPHLMLVTSAAVALALGSLAQKLWFDPLGHGAGLASIELASFSLAIFIWLRLRERAVQLFADATTYSLELLIPKAWRREKPEGSESKVPATALRRGDCVICRAGDSVPADAEVLDGIAVLQERILCGKPALRIRGVGDEVYAGSRVLKGEVTARVTAELEDSKITSFLPILERAVRLPGGVVQRLMSPILWGLLFVAACVALGWHEVLDSWAMSLSAAAAVLTLVSLLDIVRLAEFIPSLAIRTGFEHGVLIQNRQALAALGRPKEVVLEQSSEESLFGMELREFTLLDER